MSDNMVDVTLHIDEDTTVEEREHLRDCLLERDGVLAAVFNNTRPHLLVIEYDPQAVKSVDFVKAAKECGLHSELVGL